MVLVGGGKRVKKRGKRKILANNNIKLYFLNHILYVKTVIKGGMFDA